jgi:hypothetical protein
LSCIQHACDVTDNEASKPDNLGGPDDGLFAFRTESVNITTIAPADSRLGRHPAFDLQWTPRPKQEVGVRISDERSGVAYVVTIRTEPDGSASLRSVLRYVREGATLRGFTPMTDTELAERAASYLRREHDRRERDGIPPVFGLVTAELEAQERQPFDRPSARVIAEEVAAARRAGKPIAVWLSEQYKVSVRTAERWIGDARREGALTPAKPGRPAKTTSKGEKE